MRKLYKKLNLLVMITALIMGIGVGTVSAATTASASTVKTTRKTKVKRTVPKKLRGNWYVNVAGTNKYAKFELKKRSMRLRTESGTGTNLMQSLSKKNMGVQKYGKNKYSFFQIDKNGNQCGEPLSVNYTKKKINGKTYKALAVSFDMSGNEYYIKKKVKPKISNKAPKALRGDWYETDTYSYMHIGGNTLQVGTDTYKVYFTWGNFGTYNMYVDSIGSVKNAISMVIFGKSLMVLFPESAGGGTFYYER